MPAAARMSLRTPQPRRTPMVTYFGSMRHSSSQPRVGIIGAGVAGLQAIRSLRAKGFEAQAFEKCHTVGGVWRENYTSFGLQVPKQLYEFPDFPMDKAHGSYPKGTEVQQYIEDYTDHFDLRKSVSTNTKVDSIEQTDKGWLFKTTSAGQAKEEHFDYCVVANGLYSKTKLFMPTLAGHEKFQGKVMHSSDFQDRSVVEGKRVVVVGGGKSAVDCAVEASKVPGAKVSLVSRHPHWPTPRKIANILSFQYIFYSRFGQALVAGHRGALPGSDPAHIRWLHKLGWPAMAVVFSAVEVLFAAQFRNMAGKTSPLFKCDVVSDFYGHAQVLDYTFRDQVAAGKVDWVVGKPSSYGEQSLGVDGQDIPADVVIFATGFQKDYSVLPEAVRTKLHIEADGLYLWRHTLPPHVPRLAFVGSEVASVSNIMTHGLQSRWLSGVWAGEVKLPTPEKMDAEIAEIKAWKRSWMPETTTRASQVLLHQTHYHDTLMKDIGAKHLRKMPNFLAEAFMPYEPQDYQGVVAA